MSDPNDAMDDDGEDTIGALDVTNKAMEAVMKGFMTKLDGFTQGLMKIQAVGTRGTDGGFSGKLVAIGQAQLGVQNEMAKRLAQIQINLSSPAQKMQMLNFQRSVMKMVGLGNQGILSGSGSSGKKGDNNGGFFSALKGLFSGFKGIFKGMFGGLKKIWEKTGGALFKKTGSMGINKLLGLGGISIIGALVGKMIASSPLLQAMFKVMNTSLTLILRPIGDFVGSFLRPVSMYFLKEVAIPAFKKGQGLMNIGEKWGKIAVGFFVSPSKAIQSGITLALAGMGSVAKALFGVKDSDIKEAEMYQKDPAKYKRYMDLKKESDINRKPISQAGMVGILGITGQGTTANYGEFGTDPNFMGGMEWFEDWEETIDTATTVTGEFGDSVGTVGESVVTVADKIEEVAEEIENTTTVIINGNKAIETGTFQFEEIMSDGNEKIEEDFTKLDETLKQQPINIDNVFGQVITSIETGNDNWWDSITTTITDGASWIFDSLTSLTNNIDLGKIGVVAAFGEVEDEIGTAGDKLSAMANIATGGMFGGINKETGESISGLSYDEAVKNAMPNLMDPKDSILNKNIMDTGMSLEEYGKAAQEEAASTLYGTGFTLSSPIVSPDAPLSSMDKGLVGHKGHVGELGSTRSADSMQFETSPGNWNYVSSTDAEGNKVPISPTSGEGQKIQAIYNQQLKNKISNAAQQAHVATVGSFTTAAEGQAYILAGGGQAGLEAAAIAKAEGLNLQTHGDVVALNEAMGGTLDHSMVDKAETAVAEAEAEGIVVLKGKSISESAMLGSYPQSILGVTSVVNNAFGMGESQNMNRVVGSNKINRNTGGGAAVARTRHSTGGGFSGQKTGGGIKKGGVSTGGGGAATAKSTKSSFSGQKSGATVGTKKSTASKGGFGSKTGRKSGQFGGLIDEPIIGYGMHSGDEWRLGESQNEVVTPVSDLVSGGDEFNINIHIGNISKEADYTKLKPLIQRWILEASSRRGVV